MIDLDAIEARANAATGGKWEAMPWQGDAGVCQLVNGRYIVDVVTRGYTRVADAEFIAHARTDVPDLIAEVRRLKAEVVFLSEECDELAQQIV